MERSAPAPSFGRSSLSRASPPLIVAKEPNGDTPTASRGQVPRIVLRDDHALPEPSPAPRIVANSSRHAQAVYGWFRLHASTDEQTVLDLTAETFAQALLNLDRFRGKAEQAGAAWLFGIARNLARQHHRRGRVEMRARQRLGIPLRSIAEMELRTDDPRLRAALERLPPAQREAVELRVVEELGYAQIAEAMACSEQSARLRVSRGLRRLRCQLDSEEVL